MFGDSQPFQGCVLFFESLPRSKGHPPSIDHSIDQSMYPPIYNKAFAVDFVISSFGISYPFCSKAVWESAVVAGVVMEIDRSRGKAKRNDSSNGGGGGLEKDRASSCAVAIPRASGPITAFGSLPFHAPSAADAAFSQRPLHTAPVAPRSIDRPAESYLLGPFGASDLPPHFEKKKPRRMAH